jgi:hypothetical protein
VDSLVRSRYRLVPRNVQVLSPDNPSRLTASTSAPQTLRSAGDQAAGAAALSPAEMQVGEAAYSGQKETKAQHE